MLPRFSFDFHILRTLKPFFFQSDIVEKYENEFAQTMDTTFTVAYPYGRTALLSAIEILGIRNSEIIVPAYTCSVVAHAVVLSGNTVKFCDVDPKTFNFDLGLLDKTITQGTRAIIVTNNFGQSVNQDQMQELIEKHEKIHGIRVFLIQDCAYAFDALWNGANICNIGDVTIYGTNISKSFTSIFGGMLSTRNKEYYDKARNWQQERLIARDRIKSFKRFLYAITAKYALNPHLFTFTYYLMENTNFLNKLLFSYHKDGKIAFPSDAFTKMSRIEAAVGLVATKTYHKNRQMRKEIAQKYFLLINTVPNWTPIEFDSGANPSHFPVKVPDKQRIMSFFSKKGVQIGEVIEYCIPYTSPYGTMQSSHFPVSLELSKSMINLPLSWKAYRKIEHVILEEMKNSYKDLR